MFEGITKQSIKTVMLAQDEARRLGRVCCDTDHLLVGLAGAGQSNGGKILRSCGATFGAMREAVAKTYEKEVQIPWYHKFLSSFLMPLSADSKLALKCAYEESDHVTVRTDHLLLGFFKVPGCRAEAILATFEITSAKVEQVRKELTALGKLTEE
jgi:ATP-dependent Clp protease ATP-binding subunit ClpA